LESTSPDVFKTIFYEHHTSVCRKLTALVRDEAVAEDLAQEVFLRLYRNPPEQLDSVGAWLHRVLTRIGYDYLNKKVRERALQDKQEQQFLVSAQTDHSNEQAVIREMDREEVQEWLEELSERDRRVLMLRYSGYSYEEIAEELQVRKPVVGTLIHRATARLKKQAEAGIGLGGELH
jgi:RNA polymerase sigma factor (sigma-70 family)